MNFVKNEEFKVFKQTNVDSSRGRLVHHYSMVREDAVGATSRCTQPRKSRCLRI